MSTYVLIHGAATDSWCWHLLARHLRDSGHDVVATDLRCDDDSAGLDRYADVVVDAVGDRRDLVVVAHSFAGFTAPLVCERGDVDSLVMLQAMVPAAGEAPGEWWEDTRYEEARAEHDARLGGSPEGDLAFLHNDTSEVLAIEARQHARAQSSTPFEEPWPGESCPDVATRFRLGRDDRLFPAGFLDRVVRDQLGIEPQEMPGDHFAMLSRPVELAERLLRFRSD